MKKKKKVDVTIDGTTIPITESEAVNPKDWITLKEFDSKLKELDTK